MNRKRCKRNDVTCLVKDGLMTDWNGGNKSVNVSNWVDTWVIAPVECRYRPGRKDDDDALASRVGMMVRVRLNATVRV